MVTKRIVAIRDRESTWLEIVLISRRILLIECYSKYVGHMAKSCILKLLNLKQNVVEVVEKPFKASKFIFKRPRLISYKLLLYRYIPFEKLKIEVKHFWHTDYFRLYYKRGQSKRRHKYIKRGTFYIITYKALVCLIIKSLGFFLWQNEPMRNIF